jgi:hypothetical protein
MLGGGGRYEPACILSTETSAIICLTVKNGIEKKQQKVL